MSPLRLMLLVGVLVAGAVVLYGLLVDQTSLKLPLIVSGLAIVAICSTVLGFSLAGSAALQGESGRGKMALLTALAGGLFVLVAAGSLAVAIVLGILAGAA